MYLFFKFRRSQVIKMNAVIIGYQVTLKQGKDIFYIDVKEGIRGNGSVQVEYVKSSGRKKAEGPGIAGRDADAVLQAAERDSHRVVPDPLRGT